jgi:TolA-binding protein
MKIRTYGILVLTGLVLFASTATAQVGKNTDALLEQILQNQQKMQADIQALQQKLAEKDKEIADLRSMLEMQKAVVEEQAKVIQQAPVAAASGESHSYSARLQYDVARQLMHDVIFDVRKGEQKPWFERVVVEFKKVVDAYPHTPEAQESQLRIARIYWRYLDNPTQAKKEFNALIKMDPNGPHVKEAQKALSSIR